MILSASTRLKIYSFFFNDTATTETYTLSLHDALPISCPLLALITHTEPAPTVTSVMGCPTLVTPATAARSGSMRVSAPSLVSATHSPPAPAAIADGLTGTVTVATTVSEPGLISDTVPLPGSVTQIPLPLAATPVGSRPRRIWSSI